MNTENWIRPTWLPHVLWIHHTCPCCTSVKFKPAEDRSYDGLLRMFALRAVRCTFCWRRYYWFAFHAADPG
jgi:hypothetical protein